MNGKTESNREWTYMDNAISIKILIYFLIELNKPNLNLIWTKKVWEESKPL